MTNHYQDRISRVTDYIYDHLDDALDLDTLADVAALSRWHWHRVYFAMRGETATATVRRLRLQRASADLVLSERPVAEIAERAGYGSVAAFTRAFADAYGMPPASYRQYGSHAGLDPARADLPVSQFDVRIVHAPPLVVAVEDHQGSFMQIDRAFERLLGRLGAAGRLTAETGMVGIFLSDPTATEEDDLRAQAGATHVSGEGGPTRTLAGADYAVLRHKGPYADMRNAYAWLFGRWLPQSGRELAEEPVLEFYLNDPREVAPTEVLADLYLPLVAR